jgi:hypothetical protein
MNTIQILIILVLVIMAVAMVLMTIRQNKFESFSKLMTNVINNLHCYVFTVDDKVGVKYTNYYALNPTMPKDQPLVLGNILRCKNGCDSGLCGTSEYCPTCPIRRNVVAAFKEKRSFENVESSMQLYTKNKNIIQAVVLVSGSYIGTKDGPRMVIEVKDFTYVKTLQRLYSKERKKVAYESNVEKGNVPQMESLLPKILAFVGDDNLFNKISDYTVERYNTKYIDNDVDFVTSAAIEKDVYAAIISSDNHFIIEHVVKSLNKTVPEMHLIIIDAENLNLSTTSNNVDIIKSDFSQQELLNTIEKPIF